MTPRMKPTKVDRLETKMRPPSEKGGKGAYPICEEVIGYAAQRQCYVFETFLFHKDLIFSHMFKVLTGEKATSNVAEQITKLLTA